MRAVVQRVLNASVVVEGNTVGKIGKGLMVLVGIERNDTPDDAAWIIKKVLGAKLWDDASGSAWRQSVVELGGEVLCVSQFTLFANFKGSRPDFHEAMAPTAGREMYAAFLERIKGAYAADKIQDGQFGAMMAVSLTNDGPVTMLFDSKDRKPGSSAPGSGASTPTPTPALKTKEEADAIAKAKLAARAAKKAEYAARLARGEIPGKGKGGEKE